MIAEDTKEQKRERSPVGEVNSSMSALIWTKRETRRTDEHRAMRYIDTRGPMQKREREVTHLKL